MIDSVMEENQRDEYLKPQPIRLDVSIRGISSAATFVTISPPKNVLIKSPKFAVENELDMEMRNKKLKFEGKQVTKQMREAIERMLNPGKSQTEEAVQDYGIGILKKKQMTGQHNNTKRVFQKYQQFEQELASIRDKSELNRIKGQLDESNHALTVARLGGRLSNGKDCFTLDYEKVLKAFNLNKKNLQIEITAPEIMSTAGYFSPLKKLAKYRGSTLQMSQNWSSTTKSQRFQHTGMNEQYRSSKERVPVNYVEKNKAVQPLHEVNREPHPLDRIEKKRKQSIKADHESPRSPKTSPYLVKDGYGQVQIKHMTTEEIQQKEHKKSGIGAQILEKFTKGSPFNRDSIDGYKKLMNKVDRILDKEIIAHFELLSQDSEQAVQRPQPLMSRQRRNYYSSTNLRKPFRRDRTVDSFTQVATIQKSNARPMSSYTRVAHKQRPLILNPSGSSLVGVQTPSTRGSLAKSPSRTRIQSAHQKYMKSRKSISTVVSSQTGVNAFYANLPNTATNSRGNGIGIFNSCGSSEGLSPKQMGLRSNPSHIKINSWTTQQRPKEVENTAFVTSP